MISVGAKKIPPVFRTICLRFALARLWVVLLFAPVAQSADETAFQYRGELTFRGAPASGFFDVRFGLHAAESATPGDEIEVLEILGIDVRDGSFAATLNFRQGAFAWNARWLEIAVRPSNPAAPGAYTTLTPRQRIHAVPIALQARQADRVNPFSITANSVAPGELVKSVNGLKDEIEVVAGDGIRVTKSEQKITVSATGTAGPLDPIHWSGLTGIPAGFADGIDNEGVYEAGAGLILTGNQFALAFPETGAADTVARANHGHFGARWAGSAPHGLTVVNESLVGALSAITGELSNLEAESRTNDPSAVLGLVNSTGSAGTGVTGNHLGGGAGVAGKSVEGVGVRAHSTKGVALRAEGSGIIQSTAASSFFVPATQLFLAQTSDGADYKLSYQDYETGGITLRPNPLYPEFRVASFALPITVPGLLYGQPVKLAAVRYYFRTLGDSDIILTRLTQTLLDQPDLALQNRLLIYENISVRSTPENTTGQWSVRETQPAGGPATLGANGFLHYKMTIRFDAATSTINLLGIRVDLLHE